MGPVWPKNLEGIWRERISRDVIASGPERGADGNPHSQQCPWGHGGHSPGNSSHPPQAAPGPAQRSQKAQKEPKTHLTVPGEEGQHVTPVPQTRAPASANHLVSPSQGGQTGARALSDAPGGAKGQIPQKGPCGMEQGWTPSGRGDPTVLGTVTLLPPALTQVMDVHAGSRPFFGTNPPGRVFPAVTEFRSEPRVTCRAQAQRAVAERVGCCHLERHQGSTPAGGSGWPWGGGHSAHSELQSHRDAPETSKPCHRVGTPG